MVWVKVWVRESVRFRVRVKVRIRVRVRDTLYHLRFEVHLLVCSTRSYTCMTDLSYSLKTTSKPRQQLKIRRDKPKQFTR